MTEVHEHRLRVRYCETDQMGVAHHGSFIDWLEEARTEWLRACGKSYREWEKEGTQLQVVDLGVRYLRPALYDDLLCLQTSVRERGQASITLSYEVVRVEDGEVLAQGETKLACIGKDGKLQRLPAGM